MAAIERNRGFSRRVSIVVNSNNIAGSFFTYIYFEMTNSITQQLNRDLLFFNAAAPEEKYLIRLPRTGLHNRTDFITPLFLPNTYDSINYSKDISQKNNFLATPDVSKNTVKIYQESSRQKVDVLTSIDKDLAPIGNASISNTAVDAEPLDYKDNNERILLFDGDFEGGNLARVEALEKAETSTSTNSTCVEYNIYIHHDPGHPISPHTSTVELNWFFFRIQRTIAGCCYRFHVKNMTLPCGDELQLRPVCISETSYQRNPTAGWSSRLIGDDITYSANEPDSPMLYTLSFSLFAEFDNDSIYVAPFAPYTYTHLQNVIHALVHDPQNSNTLVVQTLCHSAAGNRCDLLIITDSKDKNAADSEASEDQSDDEEQPTVVPRFLKSLVEKTRNDVEFIKSKRAVVFVARQASSICIRYYHCDIVCTISRISCK